MLSVNQAATLPAKFPKRFTHRPLGSNHSDLSPPNSGILFEIPYYQIKRTSFLGFSPNQKQKTSKIIHPNCFQIPRDFKKGEEKSSDLAVKNMKVSASNFLAWRLASKKVAAGSSKRALQESSFQRIKQLGKGEYGKIFLAIQKYSGLLCCLKVISKQLLREQQIINQFVREIKIQSFLDHPNIIKLWGYFSDQDYVYIVMEPALGGQLYDRMQNGPLPEKQVQLIFRDVCKTLQHLHKAHIMHRDIKPQNIVFHENVVKLCDFGWSVFQNTNMRKTFCGTPLYTCPQIFCGIQYNEKSDIWALGIMLYEALVGKHPFRIRTTSDLAKVITDEHHIPKQIGKEAREFLNLCLQKKQDNRPRAKILLTHPFLA